MSRVTESGALGTGAQLKCMQPSEIAFLLTPTRRVPFAASPLGMLFDNCGIEPAVPKPDIDKVTRSDGVKVLRQSASVPCFHPAAIGAPRPAYLPWRRQNQSQSAALIMRAPPPMPRCAHSCSLVSAQQHVYSTRTRTHVHSHVHVRV